MSQAEVSLNEFSRMIVARMPLIWVVQLKSIVLCGFFIDVAVSVAVGVPSLILWTVYADFLRKNLADESFGVTDSSRFWIIGGHALCCFSLALAAFVLAIAEGPGPHLLPVFYLFTAAMDGALNSQASRGLRNSTLGAFTAGIVGIVAFDLIATQGRYDQFIWMQATCCVSIIAFVWRAGAIYRAFHLERLAEMEELKRARIAADAASHAKSEFLAQTSHEVRTPLHGILGMAQLLQKEDLPPDHGKMVGAITASGESLLTILNDVLDLSKVEAGKLSIAPAANDLNGVMESLITLWRAKAEEKGIGLDYQISEEASRVFDLDAVRVRQCVSNLISNAVKFTDTGKVSVYADAEPLSDDRAGAWRITIRVEDTGPGIAPEAAKNLFQPFSQAELTTAAKHGGTGLGLSISRKLAGLMDGDVSLESEPGVGSTFSFHFRACQSEVQNRDGAGSTRDRATSNIVFQRSLKVLVVDDNVVNQKVARLMLAPSIDHIVDAMSGREALDALGAEPFDVVLMDMRMPGMSGKETLAAIRSSREPWRDIPVVAVTADAGKGEFEQHIAMGFDGYVSKPYSANDLCVAISQALGRAERQADAA